MFLKKSLRLTPAFGLVFAVALAALGQGNLGEPVPVASPVGAIASGPSSFLSIAIHWVVVPLILLIILVYACMLPQRTSDASIKTSGNAGIFAGLIVFIIFVVSQQKSGFMFSWEIPAYSFDFFGGLALIVGAGGGFGTALVVDIIKQHRALGFLVLFIVATTTIAMYGYFFIKDVRSLVLFTSLGIMLGALLHIIWFPEAMTDILAGPTDKNPPPKS
ncbi:MAG TPA: hypothetical protein VKC61_12325 [Pyrinomonadaceae bacterium]|nr:hypothetical protein [Pyrinomonadaceae bacterium]